MENASQALLIAGGVLVGVLVLSLAVFLFVDFGSTSSDIHKQVEEQQLIQFNSKFTSYDGKKGITIYDVVTVAGYAKENNEYYKESNFFESDYKIVVNAITANGKVENLQDKSTTYYNQIIQSEYNGQNALLEYECTISYHDNGRVAQVNFKKK